MCLQLFLNVSEIPPASYTPHRNDYSRYEIAWSWPIGVLGLFHFPTIIRFSNNWSNNFWSACFQYYALTKTWREHYILMHNPQWIVDSKRCSTNGGMTDFSIVIMLSSERLSVLYSHSKTGWFITSIFAQSDGTTSRRESRKSCTSTSIVSTVFLVTRLADACRYEIRYNWFFANKVLITEDAWASLTLLKWGSCLSPL